MVPWIRLISVQAEKVDCGSHVSNWKGKNKAAIAGKPFPPYSSKYVYPFPD